MAYITQILQFHWGSIHDHNFTAPAEDCMYMLTRFYCTNGKLDQQQILQFQEDSIQDFTVSRRFFEPDVI